MNNRARGGPLQGVRVVELTKVWAGPFTGKLLAFLGAQVMRVESHAALDVTRFYGGVSDINKAPGFMAVNPQKLSVQIDVKKKEGVALLLDLLRKSDVLIENLRPGAMQRSGLSYDVVKAVNPNIVYVSMGMYGNEGPLSYQTGYAPCFAALSGISLLVGHKNNPVGMNIRYGDSTYGTAAALACISALVHLRRTGEGQYVDVSAVETLTSMIGDTVMDFTLNGTVPKADGNRHPAMAPHGVYRCQNNEWVSIAVSSDAAWKALTEVMKLSQLAEDPLFFTFGSRKSNEAELDAIISAWTGEHDASALEAKLQMHGIAAAKSSSSVDLVSDVQLWARGFFPEVTDHSGSKRPIVGPSWRMSRGAEITDAAPALGEHTAYVLSEILGLSAEEQKKLAEAEITR